MRSLFLLLLTVAKDVVAQSASNVCTKSNVQSSLAAIDITGITINTDSIVAISVSNHTVTETDNYPGATGQNFCNVTFSYSHNGIDDSVSDGTDASVFKHASLPCGW